MSNEPIDQIIKQLKSSNNILLLVSEGGNLDAIAAGLALKEFLVKQDKQVQMISPTPLGPKLQFLPESSSVRDGQVLAKNLVLEVSLGKTALGELKYQKTDDKLAIFLTPKSGEFAATDVTVKNVVYPYDFVITLGVTNLEELGGLYSTHPQMFFDIPLGNIDYSPENESYGRINLINLTSSAVSEIIFDVLSAYDPNYLDEKIATLLLAGLIAQTNSFQTQKTSPQVFLKASKLVNLGGKQQEIITQLYRSKSLGLLRLWGRVLARLKHDNANQLVYSMASLSDLERSEAQASDIDEIIQEMEQQLSFAKYFLFLSESNNSTTVFALSNGPLNFANIFAAHNPVILGSNGIKFEYSKNLNDTETEILGIIRDEHAKFLKV